MNHPSNLEIEEAMVRNWSDDYGNHCFNIMFYFLRIICVILYLYGSTNYAKEFSWKKSQGSHARRMGRQKVLGIEAILLCVYCSVHSSIKLDNNSVQATS